MLYQNFCKSSNFCFMTWVCNSYLRLAFNISASATSISPTFRWYIGTLACLYIWNNFINFFLFDCSMFPISFCVIYSLGRRMRFFQSVLLPVFDFVLVIKYLLLQFLCYYQRFFVFLEQNSNTEYLSVLTLRPYLR